MTIPYPRALAAIGSNSGRQMLDCFEALTPNEVVELATFIGKERLTAIAAQAAGRFDLSRLDIRRPPAYSSPGAPSAFPLRDMLAEIAHQAFAAGVASSARSDGVAMLAHAVTAGIADVARRRDLAPLLTIPEDPTGTIPRTPTSVPRALNDADYAASALRIGVDVPAIKAVATVESGGRSGFDARGRPKILFEAHYFGPRTQGTYNRTHPHLSCANTRAERRRVRKYYRWDQYQRLMEAIILHQDSALESASWGKFQVMGSNHNGWPDVRSFVAAMYVSEENHLRAFEAYCADNNLIGAIRRHDWTAFARGYNGPGQEGYDTRMAAAYRANGGR